MEKQKSKIRVTIIEVQPKEKALINYIRCLKFGELTIRVKNSEPFEIIEARKSIMIDKELCDIEKNEY